MKSRFASVAVLVIASFFAATLSAADYKFDIEGQHASVTFKVDHLGFSFIAGRFNDFQGKFSHDAANPANSKVSAVINTKSIDTNHAERDKHLRSGDFLNTDKYPTITFDSTGYRTGSNGDILNGLLTIHGISKEVEIMVKHIGEGKDPWGGYRSGFRGNIKLNSTDFGMPAWVGDLEIELNIEGVKI